jgi:hypothetical protein
MTKLSDTQSIILSQAGQQEAMLATAPRSLPAAARQAVFRSMLKSGLLKELPQRRNNATYRCEAAKSKLALWGKAPRVPAG